jgi:hypothetical protein
VSDAIRIGDCFPFRNFAKNSSPCNFRLLQQYRPQADSCTTQKGREKSGARDPRTYYGEPVAALLATA